ncbi:MAG: PhzF family phenazine biosynthesis protein [Actinobacteria bacterium]|nr:PhzF family phenazine biosynthesis protein [Actinomycetota bacterium]MBO0835334.1 PhzF family phenazine biosynthesis protein [Actinomycetota bacterium]
MVRPFRQVDVFTDTPYHGNPLAVVHDADGLSAEQMQRLASWTNLSETAFLLPPDDEQADYRVRIFTPSLELPFAGHPTLGSCHAWLEAGGQPRQPGVVVQQCGAGLVSIRVGDGDLAFAAPPPVRSGPVDEPLAVQVAAMLGIGRDEIVAIQWADNGPGWIAVLLASAAAVLAVRPRPGDLNVGIAGPHPPGGPADFEVRAFFPSNGVTIEDPVTGSFNASLGQWLLASGRAKAPYLVRQGTALGRSGRVRITQDTDGQVWVGGSALTCISGTVGV